MSYKIIIDFWFVLNYDEKLKEEIFFIFIKINMFNYMNRIFEKVGINII